MKKAEEAKSKQGYFFEELTKEHLAIKFIKEYEPEEGYFVGFSGGKDSVVVLDLVQRAGVKYQAYYSATGIDPPEVIKFINDYYPYVIHKRPNWHEHKSFFGMLPEVGVPTRISRWCCTKLKKDPTKKVPLPHRIMGLRAEESSARAKRGQISYFKSMKQWLYKPIFSWLEWEMWDYIESNNLPYCKLYDEGFSRLGCVVCPFLCGKNQSQIERNRTKWPKHYVAFEKAMKRRWDMKESKNITSEEGYATTFEEFLYNWYYSVSIRKKKQQKEDAIVMDLYIGK